MTTQDWASAYGIDPNDPVMQSMFGRMKPPSMWERLQVPMASLGGAMMALGSNIPAGRLQASHLISQMPEQAAQIQFHNQIGQSQGLQAIAALQAMKQRAEGQRWWQGLRNSLSPQPPMVAQMPGPEDSPQPSLAGGATGALSMSGSSAGDQLAQAPVGQVQTPPTGGGTFAQIPLQVRQAIAGAPSLEAAQNMYSQYLMKDFNREYQPPVVKEFFNEKTGRKEMRQWDPNHPQLGWQTVGGSESKLLTPEELLQQEEIKRAGRNSVTLNMPPSESAFQKELGTGRAKDALALEQKATEALTAAQRYITFKNVMNDAVKSGFGSPGAGAETAIWGTRLAQAAGIDPKNLSLPANASGLETMQALGNQMALGQIGAEGMPKNNFSEADRNFVVATAPGLAKTPQGNALLIDIKLKEYDRTMQQRDAWLRAAQDPRYGATTDQRWANFQKDWAGYVQKNPVFTPEMMAQAKAIAVQAGNQGTSSPAKNPRGWSIEKVE